MNNKTKSRRARKRGFGRRMPFIVNQAPTIMVFRESRTTTRINEKLSTAREEF